jgi:hypothetical protein
MLETIMSTEIQAYTTARMIFNHLLSWGWRKMERNIIRAGIIKIRENIIKIPGDVGPTGV